MSSVGAPRDRPTAISCRSPAGPLCYALLMGPRGTRSFAGTVVAVSAAVGLFTLASAQSPPRTVNWDRARQAMSQYHTVIDSSGLVEVDEHLPSNIDPGNLQSLCAGRNESIRIARADAERDLRTMILDDDPISAERKAMIYRTLGAVSTYENSVERAVKEFKTGRDLLGQWVAEYPDLKKRYLSLLETWGIANLRKGEVDNCLVMTSQDRCVFPLRPGGVHHAQEGVDTAREAFEEFLAGRPDDLEVKWLLNVSYMLLGRYPKDVPPQHLLKPELFESAGRDAAVLRRRLADEARSAAGHRRRDHRRRLRRRRPLDVVISTVDYCGPLRYFRQQGRRHVRGRVASAGMPGSSSAA